MSELLVVLCSQIFVKRISPTLKPVVSQPIIDFQYFWNFDKHQKNTKNQQNFKNIKSDLPSFLHPYAAIPGEMKGE